MFKVFSSCAFYRPKANLFCSKWRNSRVWRDSRLILSNQKSVFMQLATTNLVPRVLSYPPWERGWQQPDLLQDRFERGWENAQQNNLYVLVTRFTLDLPFFRCSRSPCKCSKLYYPTNISDSTKCVETACSLPLCSHCTYRLHWTHINLKIVRWISVCSWTLCLRSSRWIHSSIM